MYIKKKYRELFNYIDNSLKFPKSFNKFINRVKSNHNLVIKKQKEYYCTYCGYKFNSKIKINQKCTCPHCKKRLLVKSYKLKKYVFKDDLAIFDRIDNYFVERIFRLETKMVNGKKQSYYFEWGRNIYDDYFNLEFQIINTNVVGTTGGMYPTYRKVFNSDWRISDSYYNPLSYIDEFIYFPYNLKGVISKIPKYKYSQLWVLASKVDYFDLIYILKKYNLGVELLIKSKLYNLALNPVSFDTTKNFCQRFMGLDKSYLPFMQKYNLTISELEALSITKIKNINEIRKIAKISNYLELSKIVDIRKAVKLTDLNENNCVEYSDYLDIAKKLGLDMKSKKTLYPKKIDQAHNKVVDEYKVKKDEIINRKIIKKYKKLKEYIYSDSKYIIQPASSYEDLEIESIQQHNCVRTYAESVASNKCDIYFMRLIDSPNRSLVTVEVRNNEIVQQRAKNNQDITKEQKKFLQIWEKQILNKAKL